MPRQKSHMEHVLGVEVLSLHEQPIPGLSPSPKEQVLYVQDRNGHELGKQLQQLLSPNNPAIPKSGAVVATMHTLTTPNGARFHAVIARGDIQAWRGVIQQRAKELGVLVGEISGTEGLVLSNGLSYPLAECVHGFVSRGGA